jgi:hypothetical protein
MNITEPTTTDIVTASAVTPEAAAATDATPAVETAPSAPAPAGDPHRLLTRQELAMEFNVCVRTVDKLLATRTIECIRIYDTVRFSREAIERFKQTRTFATLN